MVLANRLLERTRFRGVREVKARLSQYIRTKSPTCITERGQPRSVLIPFQTLLKITRELDEAKDMLEELKDERLLAQIAGGRRDYQKGKWKPAEALFKRLGY